MAPLKFSLYRLLGKRGAWSNTAAMTALDGSLYVIQKDSLWSVTKKGIYAKLGNDGAWSNTKAMTALDGSLYIIQNDSLWKVDLE